MIKEPEVWKKYNERYEVSSLGRVRRIYKSCVRMLKPFRHQNKVLVTIDYKQKMLARVVWETFRGAIPKGCMITHANGCITMNELYNLRLIDTTGRMRIINKRKTNRIVNNDTGEVYANAVAASKRLFLHPQTIRSYCRHEEASPIYNLEYLKDGEL